MSSLDPDLAAILDRHGVAHSVDALLQGFEECDCFVELARRWFEPPSVRWHASVSDHDPRTIIKDFYAPTALTALARAFAAMVAG
jgi:hypothetical protein